MTVAAVSGLGGASASAVTCRASKPRAPNVGALQNELQGVSLTSSRDGWAVGYDWSGSDYRTLIEHWNGTSWAVQASPNEGSGDSQLWSVSATSPTNAWAVGAYSAGRPSSAGHNLIEHWDGAAWTVQASPPGAGSSGLSSVAAVSSRNAWAVGYDGKGAFVEHWDGAAWKLQARLQGGSAVTATSATDAWAVGGDHIAHWNGRIWKPQAVPFPRLFKHEAHTLTAVAATSSANAWAVGYSFDGGRYPTHNTETLIEHWNGRAWKAQPSPNPYGRSEDDALASVAAISSTDAWAVGSRDHNDLDQTLVEYWNGHGWRAEPSPNPGGTRNNNDLFAVADSSPTNIWGVGIAYYKGPNVQTLALHCG